MVQLLLLVTVVVEAVAKPPWCNGTSKPDLDSNENITMIYAQAPLLSTNKKIGQKLKYFHWFHTALVFNQGAKYWTLEFDAAANLPGAVVPMVDGDKLTWDLAARWCLWEGIYNNRSHWTIHFDTIASITPNHFQSLMAHLVKPLNETNGSAFPQYNLWRVASSSRPSQTLVHDMTCGNGVTWAVKYVRDVLKIAVAAIPIKITRISINAEAIRHVNISSPDEWAKVVKYYTSLSEEFSGKTSILEHIWLFFQITPFRYVYDANTQGYVEVVGNRIPYFTAEYEELPDEPLPLPSSKSSSLSAPRTILV